MTFEQAKQLAVHQGADMRHPNVRKGVVIQFHEDKLTWHNPFSNERGDYTPTEEDKNRTDWIAGHGLAAL